MSNRPANYLLIYGSCSRRRTSGDKLIGRQFFSFTQGLAIVTLLALLLPMPAHSQNRAEQIEEVVRTAHEAGRFNGAIVVDEQGEILYRDAYGLADQEKEISNHPDQPFPIYSITKPFTAILVLQLVQEGQLELDGFINRYLPEFPSSAGNKITIHHLLTHTSGLPDYVLEMPGWMENSPPEISTDSVLAFVAALPPEFNPGKGFAYTNTDYLVLARIIESVSGQAYADLLQIKSLVRLEWKTLGGLMSSAPYQAL